MTPEERNLVTELFDRLATLEDAGRDPEAERLINDGLRQAPNAVYALVQTVLVQDEALKRANARIHQLESEAGTGAEPARQGGFLDSMRGNPSGRAGSVPSVRPAGTPSPWGPGTFNAAPQMTPMPEPGPRSGFGADPRAMPMDAGAPAPAGGSFLGTAAATAAGVIGSSLLLSGIRSMMGQHGGAHAGYDPSFGSQHGGGGAPSPNSPQGDFSRSELARQAGIDDIGKSSPAQDDRGVGLMDGTDDHAEDHDGDNGDNGDDEFDDDIDDDADDDLDDEDDDDDDGGDDDGDDGGDDGGDGE